MLSIRASVGAGGVNDRNDVKVVQTLLNNNTSPPRRFLKVDGIAGPNTRAAIVDFQQTVGKVARPDGRVDPGYKTIRLLNDPRSKMMWAGSGEDPSRGKQVAFQKEMVGELQKQGRSEEWEIFWKEVVEAVGLGTPFLNAVAQAEDARSIIRFYLRLKDWGHSPAQIRVCFKYFFELPDRRLAVKMISEASKPATGIGKMISYAAKFGKVLGFVSFLVEYVEHWRKGDYHMAFVSVYTAALGKAIPWAGMLEGSQSLARDFFPNDPNSANFVKVLKAVDPAGLGSVAVDTLGTFLSMLVDLLGRRKLDDARLARLTQRMHEGPAQFFAEMGNELGNAFYTISQWSPQELDEALSMRSLAGFARYLVTGKMPGE